MMRKHHLKVTHTQDVIDITQRFFDSKPFRGSDGEKYDKFRIWVHEISTHYGVTEPRLAYLPHQTLAGNGVYHDGKLPIGKPPILILPIFSVATLFHEYRHHLQVYNDYTEDIETDARDWSLSLLYQTRPRLYRSSVRKGLILYTDPDWFPLHNKRGG